MKWNAPHEGWYKYNSDGAFKGNPGEISKAYCIQDSRGDLIYARAKVISDTTSLCDEAPALHDGLEFCVKKNIFSSI